MVAQDHLDVPTDSETESDDGTRASKDGVDPVSAPGNIQSAGPAPATQNTGVLDLAAVASKEHTPSLSGDPGTASTRLECEKAGTVTVRDGTGNLGNSGGVLDSGATAANVPAAESSGGATSGAAPPADVPAAEITSDADESDEDNVRPAGRNVPQPSRKKKVRRDGGFLPAASGFSGYNPDDYEQKYPPDSHISETMGANARIWRVYLDEAAARDNEVIERWRDTTDVLLVFAGLFSAVVTTLVVQSSQSLQPDNSQATVNLLSELINVQRAVGLGISPDTVPRSQQASAMGPGSSDRWVNGLWFVSLALSLATALMAIPEQGTYHPFSLYWASEVACA
ncbi:hypothetical protein EWM64_g3764 [Hericium alpestre]|uniref:DUF6535 domain-containing protein n=1 Tax=Hericium alpestre TaxID=135208 RepID=A0A4Z0A1A4_9AGAM|nr:hypothetical protein EWM64_g3764 [Hericium alpestre]